MRVRSPQWLAPLRECEWVVYAKRPFAGPAAVLAYLSRYTHRVAISNRRLLALDERGVTFRWKDYRAKGKTRYKTMTLGADEFMRRFLLHVLPSGFHRIRHYGLLANAGRREQLAQARELLHVVPAAVDPHSRRSAGRHRAADLRLPALRCRDEHHRDLRSRPADPRATHVATCGMSTGTGCINTTSALRRPLPIADGFALRGQHRLRASTHHRNPASDHHHHASVRCQPPIQRPVGAIATTCDRQIPIAA